MPLADISDVDIDPTGTFKYILVKCTDISTKEEKHVVRGYEKCEYHDDIFQLTQEAVGSAYKLDCLGGGKIKHDDRSKDILVYGKSQGFGPADHSIAVEILKKRYPDYHITFSSENK